MTSTNDPDNLNIATAGPSRPQVRPPVVHPGSGNAIIVNPCQRLNPILDNIRNVSKEFGDIVPDFQLGRTTCALFLSLKYHRLHPEYIHQRIQKLGNSYNLRILLLMCDISEHQDPIRELSKMCLINNITVVVCWTADEAGAYLATYKLFEHKPPNMIKERVDKEYHAVLRSALTSINKVNKMDVETLRTSFGSFANIARASPEELRNLPGFGQVKVRRMKDAFEKPFRNKATSALSSTTQDSRADEPDSVMQEEENLLLQELQQQEAAEATRRRPVPHQFGSAADMPPPPPVPERPRVREPSPVWDIERDIDTIDAPFLVDPRLAKKKSRVGSGEDDDGQPEERPERPPSPVWDIELDLNDD